jgi:hypothetical protein
VLSPDEADAKIAMVRQQQDEARALSKQGGNQSMRNRLGFGGSTTGSSVSGCGSGSVSGSVSGSGSRNGMSDTASMYSSSGGGKSVAGSSVSGGNGAAFDISSSFHSEAGNADVIAGMLVRDGKLQRFSLSPSGVLTMAALGGGKGTSKTWSVSGSEGKVTVTSDAKPNHFVVGVGKIKLKLGANSEDEMVAWMQAIGRAGGAMSP